MPFTFAGYDKKVSTQNASQLAAYGVEGALIYSLHTRNIRIFFLLQSANSYLFASTLNVRRAQASVLHLRQMQPATLFFKLHFMQSQIRHGWIWVSVLQKCVML